MSIRTVPSEYFVDPDFDDPDEQVEYLEHIIETEGMITPDG